MTSIMTLTLNPTIDKSTAVDAVASEIKLRCDAPGFHPGGGGLNVSRAIKKLDGESTAVFTSGGTVGQMLESLLEEESITRQPIPIQGLTRENLTVFEKTTRLQYRFGMPGPHLSEVEWQQAVDLTAESTADYLVASGSLPPGVPEDFYARLVAANRDTPTRVIVDTSGEPLHEMRGTGVFMLKPNLAELEKLSEQSFESEDQMMDAARGLVQDKLAEVLVISMGSAGAALVTADETVMLRPPVVPIKSKVGAGDSMVGGIVLALSRGSDLLDAVKYGIAAGSAAVMTPGTELCRKEDVEHIYARVRVVS